MRDDQVLVVLKPAEGTLHCGKTVCIVANTRFGGALGNARNVGTGWEIGFLNLLLDPTPARSDSRPMARS